MRLPTTTGGKEIDIEPRHFWWFILVIVFICSVVALMLMSWPVAAKFGTLAGLVLVTGLLVMIPFVD